MTPSYSPRRFLARPGEWRRLLLAQVFIALVSSVTFFFVLERDPWVKAHQPWIPVHPAPMMLGMGMLVMAVALGSSWPPAGPRFRRPWCSRGSCSWWLGPSSAIR